MKHTFFASLFVTTGDKETTPQILARETAAGAVCRTSNQGHQHQLLLDSNLNFVLSVKQL